MAGAAGGAGAVVSGATGGGMSLAALSNPVGWALMGISAISSILGGRKKRKAAKKAARAQIAMGKYNANVARRNAASQSEAILHAAETQRLSQRETAAQQRMNVAARGGVEAGTDMMALLEQQSLMQLDALEMQRRSQLALVAGEQEAEQIMMQAKTNAQITRAGGKVAEQQGYSQALGTLGSAALQYG